MDIVLIILESGLYFMFMKPRSHSIKENNIE